MDKETANQLQTDAICHSADMAKYTIQCAAVAIQEAYTAPHVLYKPALSLDGNKYCALFGSNLMDGCAGFGDTPQEAMDDFDKNWKESKAPEPKAVSTAIDDIRADLAGLK